MDRAEGFYPSGVGSIPARGANNFEDTIMGHDITAYTKAPDLYGEGEDNTQIAYLRYAAWNTVARHFYKALDCVHFDGGCSGICAYAEFSQDKLIKARELIPSNDDRAIFFLDKCIEYTEGGNTCFIDFC